MLIKKPEDQNLTQKLINVLTKPLILYYKTRNQKLIEIEK
jgi:hypothetical protein